MQQANKVMRETDLREAYTYIYLALQMEMVQWVVQIIIIISKRPSGS